MERWTIDQLNALDDFTFAVCILNERANKLNRFAPLAVKIEHAVGTLTKARSRSVNYEQEES